MMLSDAEATDGGGGGGAGSDLRASFRASFGGGRPAGGSMGELVPLRSAVARTTHFDPDFGSVRKYSDRLLRPHRRGRLESVDFPGFGGAFRLRAPEDQLRAIAREQKSRHSDHDKLGEWLTTAICGNDILSSCLYVSGVVTAEAGVLSPLCLAAVAGILYLLRFVYGEAITALPMNGGSYSLLLNTASKPVASVAACLGIIAYVATAVVSGTSAAEYLRAVCPGLDADRCAVGLLFAFAVLAFLGISESAVVALAMFVGHVLTLAGLCAAGLWFLAVDGGGTAWANWEGREYPDVLVGGQVLAGSAGTALFFGLSAAMLGVSGFETAAQYVEEQKPGVFVKCLRNMWVFVAVFNPLISALSFCTLPMEDIQREADHVLSAMAAAVGARAAEALGTRAPLAKMAETWVAVDAFVVLSGAVLTAYVGVGGLIRQMAADRVLPQLLLRRNAWRRTNHHIIFGFFLLCTSQVLLLRGDTAALAGVYTFAFMGVLCIFTVGTMLLKAKRGRLPREVEAPWPFAVAALLLLLAALVGNVLSKPDVLSCFFLYVGAVGAVVLAMFQRLNVSRLLFSMVKNISEYCWTRGFGDNGEEEEEEEEEEEDREPHNKALMQRWREGPCLRWLRGAMVSMSETPYVFFCKYDDLYQINKAIIYVQRNEVTRHLLIVNVCGPGHPEPEHLPDHVEMFDAMYPKVGLWCERERELCHTKKEDKKGGRIEAAKPTNADGGWPPRGGGYNNNIVAEI